MKEEVKPLGDVTQTSRGFQKIEFKDKYAIKCTLQQSSLAEYEQPGTSAVWLGVEDANPQVMAKDAASVGIETTETVGWVKYPIPDKVSLATRMHLDRKQVASLIATLQKWLDTGEFGTPVDPERN